MESSTVHLAHKTFHPNFPPVILLHGLSNAKETWDECGPEIANRTGCQVISTDARNHGDSGWNDTISYDAMADDLAAFMDSMDIPKAILVGHSMGGRTGMRFAFKYPERLHAMIIEDISMYSTTSTTRSVVLDYVQKLKEVIHIIPSDMELMEAKKFAASFLSGVSTEIQHRSKDDLRKFWDGSDLPLRAMSGGGYEWKTNLIALEESLSKGTFRSLETDRSYEGPVLLIYGTKSPYKILENKETMLKYFPTTVYVPIEGGTHSLHIEFPEIFTQLVTDFIIKLRNK